MKEELGIVVLTYDEDGNIKTAGFDPKIQVQVKSSKLKELFEIGSSNDLEVLQLRADTVFAMFIDKINQIELADREKFQVVSEVMLCEKYENGNIKICKLKYFFVSVEENV